ncbi:translesion DNA synthesis-associated protein ImuA [Paraglaciecola aquimarina]|uniref:Translesion DNA synthesis-associated protein ImuA n=1 Tax=Paraglaciecola algarum TaxID=3050085 RepID=A0ABS9D0S6_9ALTE|nr:translesion DNA synthesis-associated protein ImuA [Paraglaciecola sp. G1-23]MCF2946535.1 translesion DNA synthesis-associated protein ImuA [Paraglaciecola sp. G1-23]
MPNKITFQIKLDQTKLASILIINILYINTVYLFYIMHPTIHYLKNKKLLWQACHTQTDIKSEQTTGFTSLDNALQGGYPEYGVIDIRSPIGIGELRLLLPSLLTRQREFSSELITFIAPPLSINSEMLAEFGLNLKQILIVQPKTQALGLWSAEQSIKSGCCHSVIIWHDLVSVTHIKRLQLAAEKGQCLLFIIRPYQNEHISLPVSLGMTLAPAKEGIQVYITKGKGLKPKQIVNINMHTYWPELSQLAPSKVLHFPTAIHKVG